MEYGISSFINFAFAAVDVFSGEPKGVTMTAILAKAAAMALVQHPVVNASCKDGKNFAYNSNINIAIAVAINGGLITPVLRDADKVCGCLVNWRLS